MEEIKNDQNLNIENEEDIDLNIEVPNIPDYVIEIKDLYKSYGKKEVLKGLDLKVKKGEVFGYIGKNGIGKSTTIDCIVGLKDYDSGEILVLGKDVKTQSLEVKEQIGYVPSEPVTYESMTGNEYLQFIGSSYGMIQSSFNKNYNFLLKKFGMNVIDMKRKIKEYSHGMKQKICLMASLIHNPKVWILDEPTVGLDIIVYEVLLKMIKDFAAFGKTVFVTSHNIELVSKVCDRVAIINDGKIAEIIDFKKEPLKRKDLNKIFMKIYGGND